MHAARLIILSVLILAIVFPYGHAVSDEASRFWQHIRPGVIVLMDDIHATIRNFVAGPSSQDAIQDDAPGVDFDRIITMDRGNPL